MKNKILFLVIAVVACIGTGCKKTRPLISLRAQNARLVGEWKLDEIYSAGAGVSSINGRQTSAGSTTEFYKPTVLKLNIDQTASLDGYMLRKDVDTVSHHSVSGKWAMEGTDITLTWDGDNVYDPEIQKYELKYVSNKEMKISYQRVNSSGGMTSDFTFTYTFKK